MAEKFNVVEMREDREHEFVNMALKGKELPGLVKRRKMESELCLEGLREGGAL